MAGLERTEEGWRVMVEVVEVRRIPETTDVLALYEIAIDDDGDSRATAGCAATRGAPRERTDMSESPVATRSAALHRPVADVDGPAPANLADILERVLDKGIVIAGDIQVNLLDIELLTIRIRLLVVSVDKAQEMGIDWWRRDPMLNASQHELEEENRGAPRPSGRPGGLGPRAARS